MTQDLNHWLLETSNPSVRYFTLTKLLGKSENDLEVAETKREIMKCHEIHGLLKNQNEDGSWGEPERFYLDKYRGTVWRVLMLAELGADSSHPQVKKACEFLMNHSQEPVEFGFSVYLSEKTKAGLPSGVIPCLTGNMVYSLIKLGYLHDGRVSKAIKWIVKYQRTDDGVVESPRSDFYKRYLACWGKHSCHMGVAKALKALSAIPKEHRSREVNDKIAELSDYFLKHHIYKKSHDLTQESKPGWLNFGFPLMYQTDILELLEIFSELKIHDPRLNDAIEILISKQDLSGKWKMKNSYNGRTPVKIEEKGEASKWITLKAMLVLKEYGELDFKN